MRILLAAFLSGLLFACGLVVSGMVLPTRVIGFLDVFGHWDPTLMFVMVGGILTHSVTYKLITSRNSPLLAAMFVKPSKVILDRKLLIGSAIFGIGWGTAGYCPGPGIVSLGSGAIAPLIFVSAMIGGILVFRLLLKWFPTIG